jgi:hypothetical protein
LSNAKRLTAEDRIEIKQVIREQKMYGWTHKEALEICKHRLKHRRGIGMRSYVSMVAEFAQDNEVTEWYAVQAKAGFLENYKQIIEEMMFVKHRLLRKFDHETSKPLEEQNPFIVSTLSRNVREQLLALAALNVGSPILMQIKTLVDKGLANEFFNNNRFLKEDRESPEDSGEDRATPANDEYSA